jgi:hypothetical protein
MTSKDKTGDKLIASMRKSKTGTVTQKTSARSASAGSTTAADTPVRKKAVPKTAPNAASAVNEKPKKTAVPVPVQDGSFSHGRRVWPD